MQMPIKARIKSNIPIELRQSLFLNVPCVQHTFQIYFLFMILSISFMLFHPKGQYKFHPYVLPFRGGKLGLYSIRRRKQLTYNIDVMLL